MEFDVLIVGGGPAGLSASIRLMQLCSESEKDLSVCVIEKGSEIGSHVLSGNVFDPKGMNELFPQGDWVAEMAESTGSVPTPVASDAFSFLTEEGSWDIPNALLPSQLHNEGNYLISLSQMCRWMGERAEELGAEIYPGFAASDVLWEGDGVVSGVTMRDAGIGKDEKAKPTFEPGMNLRARQTLFSEGARGSCTKSILDKLEDDSHPQTYGLGIKEVWEIPPENKSFRAGMVRHTLGWPLQNSPMDKTFGGTFLYHQEPNLVHCGLVIGLDYRNPYLNPYKEFQKWKTHPSIREFFQGGECVQYGARVLNEGGWHSIPKKLTFPGGMFLGCSAGFLNSVKIKGSHCAIKSGIEAAEAVFQALTEQDCQSVADAGEITSPQLDVTRYDANIKDSWVGQELYQVRNTHAAFQKWGFLPGLLYTGAAAHFTKGREPWTLSHGVVDADMTDPAEHYQEIDYAPPDGVLTFDVLTNLQRSGTYHDDDQPSHLRIKPNCRDVPVALSMQIYGAPEQRFCPAGVYEYVPSQEDQSPELVINAQNCIHCKCCSIKMPHEYIDWTVPEGGGGPQYQSM